METLLRLGGDTAYRRFQYFRYSAGPAGLGHSMYTQPFSFLYDVLVESSFIRYLESKYDCVFLMRPTFPRGTALSQKPYFIFITLDELSRVSELDVSEIIAEDLARALTRHRFVVIPVISKDEGGTEQHSTYLVLDSETHVCTLIDGTVMTGQSLLRRTDLTYVQAMTSALSTWASTLGYSPNRDQRLSGGETFASGLIRRLREDDGLCLVVGLAATDLFLNYDGDYNAALAHTRRLISRLASDTSDPLSVHVQIMRTLVTRAMIPVVGTILVGSYSQKSSDISALEHWYHWTDPIYSPRSSARAGRVFISFDVDLSRPLDFVRASKIRIPETRVRPGRRLCYFGALGTSLKFIPLVVTSVEAANPDTLFSELRDAEWISPLKEKNLVHIIFLFA